MLISIFSPDAFSHSICNGQPSMHDVSNKWLHNTDDRGQIVDSRRKTKSSESHNVISDRHTNNGSATTTNATFAETAVNAILEFH